MRFNFEKFKDACGQVTPVHLDYKGLLEALAVKRGDAEGGGIDIVEAAHVDGT